MHDAAERFAWSDGFLASIICDNVNVILSAGRRFSRVLGGSALGEHSAV